MSWSRSLLLATSVLLLAGCGFQLRGSFSIRAELQPIHIDAPSDSRVATELRQILRRSGAEVASDRSVAASEIRITAERQDRRVLTVSATTAEVAEYELRYTTQWLLRDTGEKRRPLTGLETIETLRDYTFDRTAVLAKQSEEESLIEEMQQDAALRILYRLQAWDRSQTPEPEQVEIEQEVRGTD